MAGPPVTPANSELAQSGGCCGASRMPCVPWVRFSGRLIRLGVMTASAKVASARYNGESRSAGMPRKKPTRPVSRPAIGIVTRYSTW